MGHVGLPLVVEFARSSRVNYFDIDEKKLKNLKNEFDCDNGVSESDLKNQNLNFSSNPGIILDSDLL